MDEPHTLAGLIRKRREIAGHIEQAQTTLRQLVIDLDNLDHTIRIFDPDIDLDEITPKPLPPRHSAFRGEISRIVLGALRTSQTPLSAKVLAQHVMAERGLNTANTNLVRTISQRTGSALRHFRIRGLVKSSVGSGRNVLWEITR